MRSCSRTRSRPVLPERSASSHPGFPGASLHASTAYKASSQSRTVGPCRVAQHRRCAAPGLPGWANHVALNKRVCHGSNIVKKTSPNLGCCGRTTFRCPPGLHCRTDRPTYTGVKITVQELRKEPLWRNVAPKRSAPIRNERTHRPTCDRSDAFSSGFHRLLVRPRGCVS